MHIGHLANPHKLFLRNLILGSIGTDEDIEPYRADVECWGLVHECETGAVGVDGEGGKGFGAEEDSAYGWGVEFFDEVEHG